MGVTYCSKHGKSGFQEICEHVAANLRDGIYRDFHALSLWNDLLVCDECWRDYNFERFENHPEIKGKHLSEMDEESSIFQEYHQAYIELPRQPKCIKCLIELRKK